MERDNIEIIKLEKKSSQKISDVRSQNTSLDLVRKEREQAERSIELDKDSKELFKESKNYIVKSLRFRENERKKIYYLCWGILVFSLLVSIVATMIIMGHTVTPVIDNSSEQKRIYYCPDTNEESYECISTNITSNDMTNECVDNEHNISLIVAIVSFLGTMLTAILYIPNKLIGFVFNPEEDKNISTIFEAVLKHELGKKEESTVKPK